MIIRLGITKQEIAIVQDKGLEQLIGKAKFTDSSDTAVLEDESARVQLRGTALPVADLVTGIVVALKGTAVKGGDFWVSVSSSYFLMVLNQSEHELWGLLLYTGGHDQKPLGSSFVYWWSWSKTSENTARHVHKKIIRFIQ